MFKKIFVIAVVSVLCSFSRSQAYNDDSVAVYTPRGTLIPDSYITVEFADDDDIPYWNNYYDIIFQNDELIGNSTRRYNCHGYAWHMIGDDCPTDSVWIGLDNPGCTYLYWQDESYSEVDPSFAEECEDEIIIDYTDDHSAVATHETDIFLSKWGKGPLMRHYKNNVPHRINELFRLVCLSCLLLH